VDIITVDFETFWSGTHSLSKMLPMTYVMHPETEVISCAVKVDDYPTDVFFGEKEIRKALNSIRSRIEGGLLIAHNNSGFDSMITSWRFGIQPRMWGCTLAMARPIHALDVGGSLKKLVEHYMLGRKDNTALLQTKGRHLCDFTPDEIAAMRKYNREDTDQCYALFKKLAPHYSAKEMWHIDATIRMLVAPQFVADAKMLDEALLGERQRKYDAVMRLAEFLDMDLGGDTGAIEESLTTQLASPAKFSEILTARGVPTPMKPSPSDPDKDIPALAKTDNAFIALQEHEDDVVSAAALARLAIKSTILETRIGAFLEATKATNGGLPVPINYCGASTTGRDSGWAYNPQNLPRVLKGSPKLSDALRNCIQAPKGHQIIVADLSGIELRVNMFLWKVPYATALFTKDPEHADLYKVLASEVLHVPYDKLTKMQRQAGKAMHLGCGFGLGSAEKFVAVAKQMAQIDVTEDEAASYIVGYRSKHPEIVQGWRACDRSLQSVYDGSEIPIDPWGMCITNAHGIRLPSGRIVRYPKLRVECIRGRNQWVYGEGRFKTGIYGGKIDENIVQALARDVLKDHKFEFFKRTGLRSALDVHDELVYVVPEKEAPPMLDALLGVMRTPPTWWPELAVWAEGSSGLTYGAAK